PGPGITKLVLVIKERNRPMPRRLGLWNLDIPANYRRINVAFSNVRVLPPDAPLPPPPALGKELPFLEWHPIAERFNGIELDGWMGDRAELGMVVPQGATKLAMNAMAAGNLGLTFPLHLKVSVNGRESEHVVPQAGDFSFELPLKEGEKVAQVAVQS